MDQEFNETNSVYYWMDLMFRNSYYKNMDPIHNY